MSYPVNLIVTGRPALVVGGGSVAARKTHDLLQGNAKVTVISPAVCRQIEELAAAGRIRAHVRRYTAADLRGAFLVVAATDDEALNAEISRDAQALGILVNVVDRPALCTFTLPAVVRRGPLTIAVSTEGQCPALASVLREHLASQFGEEYADVVGVLGTVRRELIARGWNGDRIRQAVSDLYRAGIVAMIKTNNQQALATLWRTVLGEDFILPPDA